MARPQSSRPGARDRILAAAADLFYQEGVHNVGIDRIIAASGVAKMSLYNHFKSKDALIAAWLQQQDDQWRSQFIAEVEARGARPRDRLLAICDVLAERFACPDFRGCPFINSTVELANPEHPGCGVVATHQQELRHYLLTLAQAADLPAAEDLAEQLLILMEGATVVAMMQRDPAAAHRARAIAATLLAASPPQA